MLPNRTIPCASALFVLLVAASCGGGGGSPAAAVTPPFLELVGVTFQAGPIPYAFEAVVEVADVSTVTEVQFTVISKPGARAANIQVRFTRAHLERTGALDETLQTIRVPVFGLYAPYDNQVDLEVTTTTGAASGSYLVTTPEPTQDPLSFEIGHVDQPGLDFLFIQTFGPPVIIDVDGEIRWRAPSIGAGLFARARHSEGILAASSWSGGIHDFDWLGRVESSVMSDERLYASHHDMTVGKSGYLNTVSFLEEVTHRPQSVLAEMDRAGVVGRLWDFNEIFSQAMAAQGEEPGQLLLDGVDWFHMNGAVYDASDDSIIASSRENFVVKVDYATGAIRWILGSPQKMWFTDYPQSLQPLALQVEGLPPIGQHSPNISPDGTRLMVFDNGQGNMVLADVGDSRTYSRVVVYELDEVAMTAREVWVYDFGRTVFCPIRSSAHWTASGNVIVACSSHTYGIPDHLMVVDQDGVVQLDAITARSNGNGFIHAAEEFPLAGVTFD